MRCRPDQLDLLLLDGGVKDILQSVCIEKEYNVRLKESK